MFLHRNFDWAIICLWADDLAWSNDDVVNIEKDRDSTFGNNYYQFVFEKAQSNVIADEQWRVNYKNSCFNS